MIVLEIFSVIFFVATNNETGMVEMSTEVLVTVTTGTEPVGVIVLVTTTALDAAKGAILKAEKSIQEVLEKKLASWKLAASRSVMECENDAREEVEAPGPVFWYSPKKTPFAFGVPLDQTAQPAALTQESR